MRGGESIECWVRVDGRWWRGYLEEWRRLPDGWWGWCWAEWHHEPRWYHQSDLRPRRNIIK